MTVADSCFVELDGLKLTGGYADVTVFNSGAAIYSKGIDLILKEWSCVIIMLWRMEVLYIPGEI